MSKSSRLDDLCARILRLEADVKALREDRAVFVRHQQTLGRHLRRALEDNKQLRLERMERVRSGPCKASADRFISR